MKRDRAVIYFLLVVFSTLLIGCSSELKGNSVNFPELIYSENLVTIYSPTKCTIELEFTIQNLEQQTSSTVFRTFKLGKKEQKVLLVQSLVEDSLIEGKDTFRLISATIVNVTHFDWLSTLGIIFAFLILLFFVSNIVPVDVKDLP